VKLIDEFDLPREAIPTQWLNEAKVWEALLERRPMTAMVRNLGKMTAIGLIKPFSDAAETCRASSPTRTAKRGQATSIRRSRCVSRPKLI
jgi:60 kDa SS-A/Ro ribonucleoprotein